MMVYIDFPLDWGGKFNNCSHLWSDDESELHSFALMLGLKRVWFQNKVGFPHYDVFGCKRDQAVRLGAVEVSHFDMVRLVRSRFSPVVVL